MLLVPTSALIGRVDDAVREYDERLYFDRHEQTGDYCIFMKMPHGEPPYPLMGFGDTIPDPRDAIKRLYEADTLRHGAEMLDRINRNNALIQKSHRDKGDDAIGDVAERIEHASRPIRKEATPTRIFVP